MIEAPIERLAIWLFQYRSSIQTKDAWNLRLEEQDREAYRKDARRLIQHMREVK